MNKGKLVAILLALLSASGLFVFVKFYDQVSPQAAIDVRIVASDVKERGENFLNENGFNVEGYKTTSTFISENESFTYLQKTFGLEKANEIVRNEVPVYYWEYRAFNPLQEEEFVFDAHPTDGRMIGYNHTINEEVAGANLEQDAAKQIAEDFLGSRAGKDLALYELATSEQNKQKNRTDYQFEWKKKDANLGEAELRLIVDIQGDKVGTYLEYLKVPETFSRAYTEEISVGDLLAFVSMGFSFLIFIAAVIIFIKKYKTGEIRWKFGLIFGIVILALSLADTFNSLPLLNSFYSTDTGYGVYWGTLLAGVILGSMVYGIFILFTGASGDSLTREVFPKSAESISRLIKFDVFNRQFAKSSLAGYALAFIDLGLITIFYFIAQKYFDVWSPAESPFDNIMNTALPFLAPLLVGVTAAISEEFVFRYFAISFFKKYFKYTFLALLIPAVIWAFGHSNYEIFPVYVRGIELTLIGLLYGYFFIKFDIWTCIIAHFATNAILVSMPLLRSENPYFFISGLAVIGLGLLPVIPALFKWRKMSESS